ncbi:OprO/OprP family phosphate-selective porin [Sulfurimonas marina]|uniref:Porin n=1 Tax=Sulfurimonas marina TaxID=2590551 RepID=A0A7M3V9B1_9BACT|nr:porin [Sulfurimonas marina]QOP40344.1 hypothetical protein FJR03_00725 [Sulfurimonas marina]
MRYLILLLISFSLFANNDTNTTLDLDTTTKKEKKKKKVKYVKKRSQEYKYQQYIANLSNNKKPIGPYDYRYSFGAQISYDIGYIDQAEAISYDEPKPFFDHDFRRARISHSGSFFDKKLFYELEYSLIEDEDHYKDFYIGYKNKLRAINGAYRIKAGNLKVPFSLYRYSTSKNLSFMERPLGDDAFSIPRKLGVELLINSKLDRHLFSLFVCGFTNSIDERKENEINKPGASLRATYTYKASKRELLHLGFGALQQDYKNEDLRYRQNSESSILDDKYVSVRIRDVNDLLNKNFDLLFINHKYSLQAGYTTSDISADKDDYSFYSYFMEGSYFLLGKGKRFDFKESKFSKIKPRQDGAVELALRYSYINLNDKDEHGGEQTNYGFGVNWYINDETKVMTEYIMALPKDTDDYDGLINIYQMRIQFAF